MSPLQQPGTSPWCHVDAEASWGSLRRPDRALRHTARAGQHRLTLLAFEAVVTNEPVKTRVMLGHKSPPMNPGRSRAEEGHAAWHFPPR